ncbi:unnamed protein product [Adineta steineri]|uniref:SCP domain-containing protein n=1 Tax=Adineta steineri TaxID=433720 RepID=A0A814SST8_9BILA|nr:unnamed protein product [Adineta steineri]CAF1151927.1 unnamed protein product [Adineta steineri]CAF3832464.1 unnamed protein product [Adineta steineri]CAF4045967.1 unnamed protein product [Adineta steineri]
MSQNNVFGSISDFFSSLGNLNGADQVNAFFQYYWYVWLIIALAVVIIIAVNVAICYYFCHHRKLNEIDPLTGEKRLYNKEWGITKPLQSVFIPVEQNKKDEDDDPADIDQYDDSKFAIEALMEHNQFRIQHGAGPLMANEYLNKAATDWARELAKINELKHSPDQWRRYQGSVLGESLAYFIGPILKGDRLTDMWYREVRRHDFNADLQENTLHFSQVVWKGTREVGFGRCQTEDKKQWYGVALYYPPGNFPNQYAYNVLPRSDLEDFRLA